MAIWFSLSDGKKEIKSIGERQRFLVLALRRTGHKGLPPQVSQSSIKYPDNQPVTEPYLAHFCGINRAIATHCEQPCGRGG